MLFRSAFNVSLGLQVFDQAAVQAAIDKVMAETYVNNKKLKLMTILGTRPEIIRLSEVIKKCDKYFDHILVHLSLIHI